METPFHYEQDLDRIATVGAMIDVSNLDNLRRNLKQNQNAHLEILASLGTAIAVFDAEYKLVFYNQAFVRLWQLEDNWPALFSIICANGGCCRRCPIIPISAARSIKCSPP